MIKSRRIKWAGQRPYDSTHESDEKHKVLDGKPEGKRPHGISMRRCEDNINVGLKETGNESIELIHLAQDTF
jgi:hypothetical protein